MRIVFLVRHATLLAGAFLLAEWSSFVVKAATEVM
ncbi:hypothetical protein RCH10_001868 [Variovorax sp. GrIS 2.14]